MKFMIAGLLLTLMTSAGWAERWESGRRIRELRSATRSDETTYSRDRCIGHENAHRSRIERSMAEILKEASS